MLHAFAPLLLPAGALHASFPLFARISVKGKRAAPLYRWSTRETRFLGDVPWNFTRCEGG